MPSTARTCPTVREKNPLRIGKYFFRSVTVRSGCMTSSAMHRFLGHRRDLTGGNLPRAPASGPPARLDLLERRFGEALRNGDRTPGMEAAALREPRGVGYGAFDDPQTLARLAQLGQRGLQPRGVGMQRLSECGPHVAVFDDLPCVH